jgi:hypothetical protein
MYKFHHSGNCLFEKNLLAWYLVYSLFSNRFCFMISEFLLEFFIEEYTFFETFSLRDVIVNKIIIDRVTKLLITNHYIYWCVFHLDSCYQCISESFSKLKWLAIACTVEFKH